MVFFNGEWLWWTKDESRLLVVLFRGRSSQWEEQGWVVAAADVRGTVGGSND